MRDIIICIVANLFRIYIIYRFMRTFFGKPKVSARFEFLMYTIFFVLNTYLFLQYHTIWINVTNNLLGMGLLALMYTESWKRIFFVSTSVYLVNMGCDIISTVPFAHYTDGQIANQIYFIITVFLILICELIIERWIGIKSKNETDNSFPLILVPMCSISIIVLMTYIGKPMEVEIVIVSIGLLLVNFLILYLYNILSEALAQQYENKILNQKVQMYSNQLHMIIQSEDRVNTLRHDMKHHMNELKLLAMKKDSIGVQNYIDHMEEFIHNPDEIIQSGNIEIDSLLNYMLKKAKDELLEVNVTVELEEELIHFFDINIILGNLLENAIEASKMTEEKILNGIFKYKKGIFKVKIENSYNGDLAQGVNGFLSTKMKKEEHGIGLKSVQKIVEKYNGVIQISAEKRFCVNLILYMPEAEKV